MAIDLKKIIAEIESGANNKLPPVHLWQPEVVGEMDLVIDSQQQWFHEGAAFQRQSLVKLLASVMRLDDGEYYLVTPTEKMKIHVEDVPFSIISILTDKSEDGQNLGYTLINNTEQSIKLDAQCQWQLRQSEGVSVPYVEVRNGLWAKVSRAVYYQMIELAQLSDDGCEMVLHSHGSQFSLGAVED